MLDAPPVQERRAVAFCAEKRHEERRGTVNSSWLNGSVAERLSLRWKRPAKTTAEPLAIFEELKTVRKVLIAPNDRVGGLFIGGPAYKAIRHHYPEAEIHLLVDEPKRALGGQIPFVDKVVSDRYLDHRLW